MRPRGPLTQEEVRQWLEIFYLRLEGEDDTPSAALHATRVMEGRKWAKDKLRVILEGNKLPPNVAAMAACVLQTEEWRNGFGQTFEELLESTTEEAYRRGYRDALKGDPSKYEEDGNGE